MNHSERAHALLSASSSDRWLSCTPSARLNDAIPDEGSSFAAEGTQAHELGERVLVSGRNAHEIEGDYSHAMRDFVQSYVDYVRDLGGALLVEQRLDLTPWVPEAFGTSDGVVFDDTTLHVLDLKYGKGVQVFAERNTQLMLYALGAIYEHEMANGPFARVTLHIVQPRLDHFDAWTISYDDLMEWGESIKPIAKLAFEGNGDFNVGDHCTFCKVRHTCRARADAALRNVGDLAKGVELTNAELAAIYPKLDGVVRWANDLESYYLAKAEAGVRFNGLKLVEGRSVRRVTNDQEAMARLQEMGLPEYEYTTTKLVGIGDLEKLVGKKEFAEQFADIVIKPPGKPTLVSSSDKRPEISNHDAAVADLLKDAN